MKVNEGRIYFGKFDSDGNLKDSPDKTWDLKDLIRCALEQDVVDSDESATGFKKINTSKHVIEQKLKRIFMETGDNYVLASVYTDENALPFDPFSDMEEEYTLRHKYFGNLASDDKLMKSAMKALSYLRDLTWKKDLIVWMLRSGYATSDEFKLETEFKDEEVADFTKEELKQLVLDNVDLNNKIDFYKTKYKESYNEIIDEYLDTASKFATPGNEDLLRSMLLKNVDKILVYTANNVWRDIYGDKYGQYGWKTENENGKEELIIDPSTEPAFRKLVMGTKGKPGLKRKLRNLILINSTVSRKTFNIKDKEWDQLPQALNWMMKAI